MCISEANLLDPNKPRILLITLLPQVYMVIPLLFSCAVLNVGNGLALLGMTTLIGEFFLTYFAKVSSIPGVT